MQVIPIVTGPFQGNAYLIWKEGRASGTQVTGDQAILIDPGDNPDQLKAEVEKYNLKIIMILATHAHLDHVGAAEDLRRWSGAPFCLPAGERKLLSWLPESCLFFGVAPKPVPQVDYWLDTKHRTLSESVPIDENGGLKIIMHSTPGHSPDGVSYQISNHLFSGDTLFAGSVGRTDLPGGDWPTLVQSLSYLVTLPDEMRVWPGHGPETTIGYEKRHNPFLTDLGD